MISKKHFSVLQNLFYSKVASCCNSATVRLIFFSTDGGDRISNFVGDNKRVPTKTVDLNCLYQRNLNDKMREKLGVNQEITDIIYISPQELQKKTGNAKFPEEVRNSYAMIAIEFLGNHYELNSIVDLEPMHNGNELMCIAYQLNLKTLSGKYKRN